MKKIMYCLVVCVLLISMVGCSQNSEVANNVSKVKNDVVLNLGDKVKYDYIEVEITKTFISRAVTNKDTNIDLEEKEGFVYFVLFGNVKNLNTSSIQFASNLATKLIFDNKYEYEITIEPTDLYDLVPLQTADFAMYASVPQEVINSCEQYCFQFGFDDDFSNYSDLKKCKNVYTITGDVEEYGSAENIENFQTFKEYVENKLGNYTGLKGTYDNSREIIDIKKLNNIQGIDLDDGSELSLDLNLRLNYGQYKIDGSTFGTVHVSIETSKTPEHTYFSYADTLTVSSDTGELVIGNKVFDKTLIDTRGIDHLETQFNISDLNYSIEELKKIVDGDNLKMTFVIDKTVSSKKTTETIEVVCEEKVKTVLQSLIDLYLEI